MSMQYGVHSDDCNRICFSPCILMRMVKEIKHGTSLKLLLYILSRSDYNSNMILVSTAVAKETGISTTSVLKSLEDLVQMDILIPIYFKRNIYKLNYEWFRFHEMESVLHMMKTSSPDMYKSKIMHMGLKDETTQKVFSGIREFNNVVKGANV